MYSESGKQAQGMPSFVAPTATYHVQQEELADELDVAKGTTAGLG
jgi:hypothetical protein